MALAAMLRCGVPVEDVTAGLEAFFSCLSHAATRMERVRLAMLEIEPGVPSAEEKVAARHKLAASLGCADDGEALDAELRTLRRALESSNVDVVMRAKLWLAVNEKRAAVLQAAAASDSSSSGGNGGAADGSSSSGKTAPADDPLQGIFQLGYSYVIPDILRDCPESAVEAFLMSLAEAHPPTAARLARLRQRAFHTDMLERAAQRPLWDPKAGRYTANAAGLIAAHLAEALRAEKAAAAAKEGAMTQRQWWHRGQ